MQDLPEKIKEKKTRIDGIINGVRTPTQELLQEIYRALDAGSKDFEIYCSGQHDIGGPLLVEGGEKLNFKLYNPGQRVGSMGMSGTHIVVEGSAPADVGWLNAGAEIVVKGDCGDTAAHCAASGKIYVGGRVGTRSGALMKHDPKFLAPEFWVLKNTGSFSFEFMGGGIAVICGWDCENLDSVLGYRSCIGMVGGTVYVRGNISNLSDEVWLMELDEGDKEFLLNGMPEFLSKIEKPELLKELGDFSSWKKIRAKSYEERNALYLMPTKEFRINKWVNDGIFGDLIQEDYFVAKFVEVNRLRIRYPEWRNAKYSAPCEYNCPIGIPTQRRIALLREGKTSEALRMVLNYSPFPASVCGQVCPNLCIDECNRKYIDIPVKTKELGLLSKEIKVLTPAQELNNKVAIIGSGAAGLASAWYLRRLGYKTDVYEEDSVIGGKLKQVIPTERLDENILDAETQRIKAIGVNFILNYKVDEKLFGDLINNYDAVVVAVGAQTPVVIPFEGHERLIKGLEFLKAINKGEKPKIGEKVVVIGAGNAAMDVIIGAYNLGAKEVTAIDIQKPAAFENELEHAKSLGANIIWPCFTEKITDKGVHLKDGRILEADSVIISVGDRPDFSLLSQEYLNETGKAKVNEFMQSEVNSKVFIPGDAVKLGLFTNALADGRKVAMNIDRMLTGLEPDNFEKAPMLPKDRVKKEYYSHVNPQRVMQMPVNDETTRCMSCGYCRDCYMCIETCPEQAISRIESTDGTFEYYSDPDKCIGCGICAGVFPCGIWTMLDNFITYEEA